VDFDFSAEWKPRSVCELVGGPLDGCVFRWPKEKRRVVFGHHERNPTVYDIYVRESGTDCFRYQGWTYASPEHNAT
jgi:hypothetical protein